MPMNEPDKILCASGCLDRARIVREWLALCAEIFRDREGVPREVTTTQARAYDHALDNVPVEQLAAALDQSLKICRFFPTPADVFALVEKADAGGAALVAEEKWHELLVWVRAYVSRDLRIGRRAPKLDPAVDHAARAAGGVYFLEDCSEDELKWAKKRFLEDYATIQETGAAANLLTRREAKQILANLKTVRPVLASSADNESEGESESMGLVAARDAFAEVAECIPAPELKPAKRSVLRFPVDPGHEAKVRHQAAEILAKARAQA